VCFVLGGKSKAKLANFPIGILGALHAWLFHFGMTVRNRKISKKITSGDYKAIL
jgi:hypothetical protein